MAETSSRAQQFEPRRYLGLELSGAKNPKTALATVEYYPREKKVFLLDIYDRITPHDEQTADEALLETLSELDHHNLAKMGVNVPLELPTCVTCTRKSCPMPGRCTVAPVKWMRELIGKAERNPEIDLRVKEFTPYTQRPIELWVRYQVLPKLPQDARFDIDETLGGNKAPLTSRMNFLKRHLKKIELVETWPKLTVSILSQELKIPNRIVASYRQLEEGAHARQEILERLIRSHGIFIYERDLKKLSENLAAFDAFFSAYTALLCDSDRCQKMPAGFPASSGWVTYPKI